MKTKQNDSEITQTICPDEYYSGDKPNPNLKKFIEKHIEEKPYDFQKDNYNITAFNKPITTTKATAIYNMHTYWSKKPHTAITQYIKHYTEPGDLVLDPMCGSGGTALAALMENRKAVAIDISPAATFITKNYCTPVDTKELEKAFKELERQVKPEMDWLYETRCDRCGGKAITQYTVYSQRFKCPRCLEVVPLFDCIEAEVPKKSNPNETKDAMVCPYCYGRGHLEEISTRSKQFGAIPVLVSYNCLGRCKPKKGERRYNDPDPVKREYFEKYDLGKIKEIEEKDIPYWYPPHRMMNVESDTEPWGDKWRAGTSNFRTVAELYTKRNLWALACIINNIKKIDCSVNTKDALLFILTGAMHHCSKMATHKETGGGYMIGTYYLPQIFKERMAWNTFNRKYKLIKNGYKSISSIDISQIIISSEDAKSLIQIATNSVDYVFTDPPYAGKVQYGELNFVWEAWLGFDTLWHDKEIIVNETRGISETDWSRLMKQAMGECFRVLKPGRWVSLCYHDTSEGTWQLVQDLMTEVGFIPEQTDSAIYIDTGQKSYNQIIADKVTRRDLVINFRKPPFGKLSSYVTILGNEDKRTFNEKAISIIRDYLLKAPGTIKDRIYDDLVSRMVRRGTLQAHEFDQLLNQVAVASITQIGSGQTERWYLKDTEYKVDQAETIKENIAADSVQKFIESYLKKHSENEGVHYSDIFEHYIITVQDKPRRDLRDWLLDYFYVTDEGTYRLPITEEETRIKEVGREKGLSKRIRRFVSMIENRVPVPVNERPDNPTIVEWILHCRRSGMFYEGSVLYERGGLDLGSLDEVTLVEVEEAYHTINKQR